MVVKQIKLELFAGRRKEAARGSKGEGEREGETVKLESLHFIFISLKVQKTLTGDIYISPTYIWIHIFIDVFKNKIL